LLRDLINSIPEGGVGIRILDVGGRQDYWERFGLEFLRKKQAKIVLLNVQESELPLHANAEFFEARVGNGCELSEFRDGQFDLVHSNSVLEHVGNWENMQAFAREVRRTGKRYYVQTPYYWFPIDPHFYAFPLFHWFPRTIRALLLNLLPLASAGRIRELHHAFEIVDDTRLLDNRQFSNLFPDARITFETFLALPKSMIAIRRA
jgi:hypothetical protein